MIDLHREFRGREVDKENLKAKDIYRVDLETYGETTEFLLGKDLYKNMPNMQDAQNLSKLIKEF